jgi:hypothetical protein
MSGDEIEVEDRSQWTVRELVEAPFGEAERHGLLDKAPLEAITKHEDGMYTLDLDVLLAAGWELTDDGGLSPPKGDSRDR